MNKKCQVFTPPNIVGEMLDRLGYVSNLYGKKVIENACGEGNILVEVVDRYIFECKSLGMSTIKIKKGLETDIIGVEIDRETHRSCIKNLNAIAMNHDIFNVSWNILNTDVLKKDLRIKFDFVIGNPPYINYRELDEQTRAFIKENYKSCKQGQFDYCYAFIEASLNCLNETGKVSYLIPNSIFKNVFAQSLRDIILPYLTQIYDYTTKQIFENALTSSAIVILDKASKNHEVEYIDLVNNVNRKINKKNLVGKWVFMQNEQNDLIDDKCKFSDYFTASISIATQLNEAFVINDSDEENDYVRINKDNKIEASLLRLAASPRGLSLNKKEVIIFPYYYKEGVLFRYSENEFKHKFPEAIEYLRTYKEKLLKRKSDKCVKWFEYGRTQALSHLDQHKLLTSTVVTKEVKVYELDRSCIPYSGIYIIPKGKVELRMAKKLLESSSFYQYVKSIGTNANGSSLRITAKDINNFEFRRQEFF